MHFLTTWKFCYDTNIMLRFTKISIIDWLWFFALHVSKGVGRHRQGAMAPWPENSFILTIEATKIRGWAPPPPGNWKQWLGSPPLELPRALPWRNCSIRPWYERCERHLQQMRRQNFLCIRHWLVICNAIFQIILINNLHLLHIVIGIDTQTCFVQDRVKARQGLHRL